MKGDDYKLLIAMDRELKDTLHHIASQSGKTLSAFIRESVRERIENLEDLKDRGSTRGSSSLEKLGNVWQRAKRSVLCQLLLNLAIIGLCMYIYTILIPIKHF
jgi:hypothetical protein